MGKSLDVGGPVGPILISDGNFNDMKIELRRAEQQIEIPEGIEVSKILPIGHQAIIISPEEDLSSTERIFDPLIQQPGKRHTEEFISDEIEHAHGL